MHAKSFTNPVFQAQYFKEVIPEAARRTEVAKEAQSCNACHNPVVSRLREGLLTSREQSISTPDLENVTCDFCHTIKGYSGVTPGDANYISAPADEKGGPFLCNSAWHHVYRQFTTKSEFCGTCHNDHNRYGLEVKSTYSEWKESVYAKRGIQCQDCHMNVIGFLVFGRPIYDRGRAAESALVNAPDRKKLYTHRFPGAHSRSQVIGALSLDMDIGRKTAAPGEEVVIEITVDNSRTGHKMPSGSADLRLLWLEVKGSCGGRNFPVRLLANGSGKSGYDVSGEGEFDASVLGPTFPQGNRMYRAIYVDALGTQTLSFYDATAIVFDNRLNAGEMRKERFSFEVPAKGKGPLLLSASLKYLPYPEPFAAKLGLAKPEAVEIASAGVRIEVR